ncbi:unnamed protein product [Spirodela intermedia]|uniref:Uncharacterized protein n=1 Tax=Spirodela intermedia TaxID=51605 RepID=A0A7I8JRJ7_SPIIN|nr:unnamed protein product [Spirodela intermedia]CAA6672800.1 unnamed protein product [Spirodela intermedia]
MKPTVVLRAVLVSGIAAFAKVAGAMKAAGGVKIGAAAAAMTLPPPPPSQDPRGETRTTSAKHNTNHNSSLGPNPHWHSSRDGTAEVRQLLL